MPKGKSLTDEERKEIYEARMLGESREEIARAYGIATASVTAIVRRYRQKETGMAGKECVVAGNKKSGRLMSTLDPHRY
jgi:transposase-like protein